MKTLLLGFALLTSSAFASSGFDSVDELVKPPRGRKHCRGLKITDEQKASIKTTVQQARTQTRGHRGAIKAARKNLKTVLLNVDTTRAEVRVARAALRSASAPVRKVRRKARIHIAFDILTGEQRVKATKCKMRSRRNRRGGGHHRF